VQNGRAAKQARAKKQKQAAMQKANWAASKQKVPVRLAEWKFKQLVGCSKNHGGKIHWQTEDGEDCSRSHCTWQPKDSVPGGPSVVQLDTQELQGAGVSIEIAGKVYEATVHGEDDEGCSGANSTSYYLEYKKKIGSRGRAKVSGWVDFDLAAGEKCSWWRLDGYDTCGSEAEDSDADPQAPLDEEMGVDSEEEGHRGGGRPLTWGLTWQPMLDS
jgi:hypothetical protein